uniref:Protein ALP1-like n=1 Tax=Tanacetum cinerariifolium TaxID=118510 RepID=A0A6L2LWQ3_TANCI|nr:uncharacterized protein [Tanacetum cinerariifolium]
MNQNNDDDEERQPIVFEIDEETDVYFLEQAVRPDATGRMSLSVIMKCTTAIRQLAYGTTPDAFDEYLQMSANNDINVLDNSPLFNDLLDDKAPVAPYVVNGVGFENGYYLVDGIYPQWATFVKSFTLENDAKRAYFKKRQEGARKDVEHQKMAVFYWNDVYANPSRNMQRTWVEWCETQRRKNKEIRDREMHLSLQRNLMEHIWQEVEHEDEDISRRDTPLSWTINHLQVNANIVDRPIGIDESRLCSPDRTMSSPDHPTSNIEDAFSSNFPDYTTASRGNISPDPPDNLSKYLLASPAISPFHNVQAYNAANKPPILSPDPITPPVILTPSPVLPPSPLFDP